MKDIKTITLSSKNIFEPAKPSLFGKFLPIMLIISFAFAGFYSAAQSMVPEVLAIYSAGYNWFFALYLLFVAVLDYAILLLVMWLYKKILSLRPYFYLVRTQTFNEHFQFWYFIRNVIYGAASCVLFACPYLQMYFPILSLLLTFMVVLCTYFSLSKQIDMMFRHMYFKLLMYPFFIFETISIVLTIIMGGY